MKKKIDANILKIKIKPSELYRVLLRNIDRVFFFFCLVIIKHLYPAIYPSIFRLEIFLFIKISSTSIMKMKLTTYLISITVAKFVFI